ncbi:hypothetical protein E2C01_054711 [Portunus trituberculatus]|uniref:Uncharacterized protein n=1 Tax=Portunus trituberculatus TaxID=210409 RepID=A0A5B7GU11_PORTR|nr:hypothetical protein [Portunus trituberculatus]
MGRSGEGRHSRSAKRESRKSCATSPLEEGRHAVIKIEGTVTVRIAVGNNKKCFTAAKVELAVPVT